MMSRFTLTNRLLLFFLGTLALVLVSFSAAVYSLASLYLHQQVEERLAAAVNTLAAAAEIHADDVEWEPRERTLTVGAGPLGGGIVWLVCDEAGKVVDSTPDAARTGLLEEAREVLAALPASGQRGRGEGRSWQIARQGLFPSSTAPPGSRPLAPEEKDRTYSALIVTVGMPSGPVHTALRSLALVLGGSGLAVWLLVLSAGRWVCRQALAPVSRMATVAQTMSGARLDERLPSSAAADELQDLSRAFNGLLDRLQESFARQQRFTGDASHQLRTPLTAMLGQVEVALRRRRSVEEYERVLGTVQGQALHLRQIIESLLFLARADGEALLPDLEAIDLDGWTRQQLASWLESKPPRELRLEVAGEGPFTVKAQPALLAELVNNLLDNAMKYSPPGTPITVRLCRTSTAVVLAVEDRGEGVRDEDLPRLFEPFYRSAEARRRGIGGVGLGLAVAARLARAFGGRIEAVNLPEGGSRFNVHFPLGMEPA